MQELSKSWSKGCFISRDWELYTYEISVSTFCSSFRSNLLQILVFYTLTQKLLVGMFFSLTLNFDGLRGSSLLSCECRNAISYFGFSFRVSTLLQHKCLLFSYLMCLL